MKTALPRGAGVRRRMHDFTIHEALQRGVAPEFADASAPLQTFLADNETYVI